MFWTFAVILFFMFWGNQIINVLGQAFGRYYGTKLALESGKKFNITVIVLGISFFMIHIGYILLCAYILSWLIS